MSAAYFALHLVLRRLRPNTWCVYVLTDAACVLVLAALAVAAQFATRSFASGQAVLEFLAFFVLAIFYAVLLAGMLVAVVRGARREGLRGTLLSSADRLKHVRRHGAAQADRPLVSQMPDIRVTQA